MRAPSVALRFAGIVAALLLGPGRSSADPPPVDAARVEEWLSRLRSETEIRVVRTITRKSPVTFATQLPSSYRTRRVLERKLRGKEADRFRALLAMEGADIRQEFCRTFPCRRDSLDLSAVEAFTGKESKELEFEILLGRGTARIHGDGTWACYRLADRGRALREFYVATFPEDRTLSAIALCSEGDVEISTAQDSVVLDAFVWVETLPEAITRVAPKYPFFSQATGKSGTVMVQALIGKDGLVKETSIVEPVSKQLDAAAVKAVEQWRFRPATAGGKPIAVWVAIPVKFRFE